MTERELQAMNDCVRIINNYLASEFEQDCAYTLNDLLNGEIGLMFTNDEFNQDELQASVDLNAKAINFYRNNKLVKSYDYETYEELASDLDYYDFDYYYEILMEEIEMKRFDITLYVKHFWSDELERQYYTVYANNREEVEQMYRIGDDTLKGGIIEKIYITE